ncbi:MAG TPA: phenylalanine--tRNA ligase subunit beta [Candidatus Limnocylindria bacterium]|nr:phenylalanine--tRNA ligase subunit beta [Candidatus Limnocylindria bacterium]
MRVPLSWLRDYVDISMSPQELADQLTLHGMEVSGVEVGGADWTDVVVGRLLSVERHPNADSLWLTSVDVGAGEPLQVVCGAQNIAPGQLVPVALVGSVLPGDRRIGKSKIRGIESQGMLCSARELGLGSDAEGIHLLGGGPALGTPLAELVGEVVLDVDVKPNRGDALSMVGLAREIAAFSGAELRLPDGSVEEDPAVETGDCVSVRIDEPSLCPRFTARWLDGVANGESPAWMQRRLVAAGMRPVSAVVDVTNYVMHELGQPMHAYDGDRVPDGQIVVRRARDGERLETIDHVTRDLDERMLVIADADRAIGLAGIMGGASTEVTPETRRVILESAIFDGPTIRNTARRLALRSEASMRHEKGIGPELPRFAADRAASLIREITGARLATGFVDNDPGPHPERVVTASTARLERLLGIVLDPGALDGLLRPLGFATKADGDTLHVSVPSFRLDVVSAEDVAEEIARAYGYGRIEGRLPVAELPPYRPDPGEPRHRVRRILAGLGLDEVVTHALIGPADLERSGYDASSAALVRVANALSEEHSLLRPVPYPSILRALAENVRQRRGNAWLFEVGKTYWQGDAGATPPRHALTAGTGRYEAWHVAIGLLGSRTPPSPGSTPADADVAELKGIVEALHTALGAPGPAFRAETAEERHPHLHPGRAGRIIDANGRAYGSIGEVDPRIAEHWDLHGRPVLAAIHLGPLFALIGDEMRVKAVPPAQPLDRDLAVVVDESTAVGDVVRITRSTGAPLLADVRLFDEYRGPQVGEGKVSYALALRFQPEDAGDERGVEKAMKRITGALRHHLGAEIR